MYSEFTQSNARIARRYMIWESKKTEIPEPDTGHTTWLRGDSDRARIFVEKFALLFTQGALQPHHKMVPDANLLPRTVQRLYFQLHVAVEEERSRVAVLVAKVDDAVNSTAIVTRSPLLEEITDVDNERVRCDRNRYPAFSRRIPDLKTL
jgi:hypothetical protein